MVNKFTEPRYYYDAIKHNIQMHLLAQVSRQDGKTVSGLGSVPVSCHRLYPKVGSRTDVGLGEALR